METVDPPNQLVIQKFLDEVTEMHHNMRVNMHFWMITLASRTSGQFLIKKLHSLLWTIEKTVKWTHYKAELHDPAPKGSEPIRPLPWIFFLPLAMITRVTCFAIYEISRRFEVIGPITSSRIIAQIQYLRRNIRFIRLQGLRDIALRRKAGCNSMLLARLGTYLSNPFGVKAKHEELVKESPEPSVNDEHENLESALNKTYSENDELDHTFDAEDIESSEHSSGSYESISESDGKEMDRNRKRRRQRKTSPNKIAESNADASYTDANSRPSSSANTTTEIRPSGESEVHEQGERSLPEDRLEQKILQAELQRLGDTR